MKTYTDDQLVEAIKQSTSISQVLKQLNLANKGGNYQTIHRHIKRLNLNTDHFTGQAHNKGKQLKLKTPIEVYLNNERPIGSFRLKNRLLREGYFEPVCGDCGGTEWFEKPMPLELDHIDGNTENNNLNNLRLLCPNCHSFTPNYRGKNQKRAGSRSGTRTRKPEGDGFS